MDDMTFASRVSMLALEAITPAIVVFGSWLAHRVVAAVERRFEVDIPAKQEDAIAAQVERAIHWAEEKSRNRLKRVGSKLRGPAKLEIAADYVLDFAKRQGWDTWGKERIKDRVEAVIGAHRANGGKPCLDNELVIEAELPPQSEELPQPPEPAEGV